MNETLPQLPQLTAPMIQVLLSYGRDVVPRSVIRERLPRGGTIRLVTASARLRAYQTGISGTRGDRNSHLIKNALARLEQRGLIDRLPDAVGIVDRRGLEALQREMEGP